MVLSPQRRSFGGGCQVAPTAIPRRPISPLENKENESLRLGGTRRIGSGRIMASRVFERDVRVEKERERDREREFKDKRFRVLSNKCRTILYQFVLRCSFEMSVSCCRETLETKECLVKGEEMTPMLKRNQSGSLVGPPVSLRPLSSLVLMTRFWRMTKGEPNAPGRSLNPSEKACGKRFSTLNILYTYMLCV